MSIRTAVIGFGTAGRVFHAPLLAANADFEVSAIVTTAAERREAVAAEYPSAKVLESPSEVFSDPSNYDLVVIASPNKTHATLAQAAIDAGIAVVVDKPIAVNVAEAQSVVDAAAAAEVTFSVFQNRRWDGDFLTLRAALESGELGEVRQFESAFEWWKPVLGTRWKDTTLAGDGGGIAYDLAPHLIDQAVELFGPAAELHSELDRRRLGSANDDDSFISIRHESGVRSRLWMSSVAPAPRPRFRVVGSEGVLSFFGLDPQEQQLIAGRRPGEAGFGLHDDARGAELVGPDGSRRTLPLLAGDYPEFYRRLARAIKFGDPAPVDPADSIAALRLIELAVGPNC